MREYGVKPLVGGSGRRRLRRLERRGGKPAAGSTLRVELRSLRRQPGGWLTANSRPKRITVFFHAKRMDNRYAVVSGVCGASLAAGLPQTPPTSQSPPSRTTRNPPSFTLSVQALRACIGVCGALRAYLRKLLPTRKAARKDDS